MNTTNHLTVRRQALWAFSFFVLPCIIGIITNFVGMITGVTSGSFNIPLRIIENLLTAISWVVSCTILSKIATNRTTGVFIKNAGWILGCLSLTSIGWLFINSNVEGALTLITLLGIVVYIKWFVTFYLYGVIERNNPNCTQTIKSLLFLFWIGYVFPLFTSYLVTSLHEYPIVTLTYDTILSLVTLGGYYMLMTSEAFAGRTDNSPAPEGAYKVWNRYFKYFLWSLLGMAAVSILYLIVTEVILK